MQLEPEESSTKAVDASDTGPTAKLPRSVQSLSVAWQGLKAAWRLEKSFRNHVFGALAMLAVLVALRPEPIWWALALLCSTLLITLELINTSIERLIDHVDRSWHADIKLIKDISAGAVIVASAGVLVVGVIMIFEAFRLFD
jgi:diacylglycerol kinase (ATP)